MGRARGMVGGVVGIRRTGPVVPPQTPPEAQELQETLIWAAAALGYFDHPAIKTRCDEALHIVRFTARRGGGFQLDREQTAELSELIAQGIAAGDWGQSPDTVRQMRKVNDRLQADL